MADPSAPGPSTRSTLRSPIKYHVFLSFRGIDTRKNFTDHLYFALLRKGIVTFRDDEELERGEAISNKLLQAIEQSLFAIVVLSKNYASSSWCLEELMKILESKQVFGLTVLPVFYDVNPSDIRYQKGNFAAAFEKHEARYSVDKVRRWRGALAKIADLSGWDTRDKHEAEIVEAIAKSVWKKLCNDLPSNFNFEHLVGDIQSKVDKIISLLKIGLDDKCFMGIWGMGGVGKTTLARVVYDAIRSKFDACCFLANVREDSERLGLVCLQKKLLSCLELGERKINDSYHGVEVLRSFLCHKKVLVVLDDVSHKSQLDNLARNEDWFGVGSKIVITTRDVQLLTQYEQCEEYEVGMLHPDESLKLLCQKTFKKDESEQGYLDLSKEVVEYTSGLPLALEVLGSFLCKRNQNEWRDTLDKLRRDLHKDIFRSLYMSYDGLEDEEYKEVFLDIACFFNREAKFEVINILKICGLHPSVAIKVLIEKSLLHSQLNLEPRQHAKEHPDMQHDRLQKMRRDIFLPTYFYDSLLEKASKEYICMHDLLQEMGRNIVLQESPNDACRRSRLWSLEDINLVLQQNMGTKNVRSIVLDLQQRFKANWHPNCFSKMKNLRLLSLSKVNLRHNLHSLPSTLKFLRWDYYAFESLPSIDQLYELESLQLCRSKITNLWKGTSFLKKLRIINLRASKYLIETPDFNATPNLEKLLLEGCENLVQVHESLGQLTKLVELRLKGCRNLVTLPSYLEMDNLEEFILCGCYKLEKLPKFGKKMGSLYLLDVRETKISKVPWSIINLINLKYLDLSHCNKLKSIPQLPPNLIIFATICPFLKLISAVSKLSSDLQGPIHLFNDWGCLSLRLPWKSKERIPRWFERREHRRSKDSSGEVVTITAKMPCNVANYEGECWAIAVCLSFHCCIPAWRGFSMNWKFHDYCHPNDNNNKSHGTQSISSGVVDAGDYVGVYPIDKEHCRPGSQVHLTLSFPTTNISSNHHNMEIVGCGWRLTCKKDFDLWINARSSDFDAWS